MITVTALTIKEFRGIRDLTLTFGGRNFAVCGPNGTGKSGIVDALEFALTGSISRLTGQGTGGLSVREHGPHVDSRKRPKEALVTIAIQIPGLNQVATLTRTVAEPNKPVVHPDNDEIRKVLAAVALHPEFVLSRRELIRYVVTEPGSRAKQVQALLRLGELETLRALLQKIANAAKHNLSYCNTAKVAARDHLVRALKVTDISGTAVLIAVNANRVTLGLSPISTLSLNASIKDGIENGTSVSPPTKIVKVAAVADIKALGEWSIYASSLDFSTVLLGLRQRLAALRDNETLLQNTTREQLLNSALREFDQVVCPVCDTEWDAEEFRTLIKRKLARYSEATSTRKHLEKDFAQPIETLDSLATLYEAVERYGKLLKPSSDGNGIGNLAEQLRGCAAPLRELVPIGEALAALDRLQSLPMLLSSAETLVNEISLAVSSLPEPSQQDAARDYLVVGQDRLEAYQGASRKARDAADQAATAEKVLKVYGEVTTAALDEIYKNVQGTFTELYRLVNRDDEGNFTAKLEPSFGKLDLDVDFYGRGYFPPGAYHSEGHQDGMGLCLYLALMKHLSGESFTFAVLDDVLMSVDSGHRREVSQMLKSQFPNTQFLFTTHDEIWLKHMKTVGLIDGKSAAHFRSWSVDVGPAEWGGRDVWKEVSDHLEGNNVREAAALLRHYLEYFSKEACHNLRAQVEFRGDAQFTLGDLLPNAVSRLRKHCATGITSAKSWSQTDLQTKIQKLESTLSICAQTTQIENWQINAAVHYNEWENLHKNDFVPVASALKELVSNFYCSSCNGMLFVAPHVGQAQSLRCACADFNINLLKKT